MGWSVLQTKSAGTLASGTTQSATFNSACTPTSLIVAIVGQSSGIQVSGVSDGSNSAYSPAPKNDDLTHSAEIYWIVNGFNTALTLTATFPSACINRTLAIHEFAYYGAAGFALDIDAQGSQTSPGTGVDAIIVPSIVTQYDEELIFAGNYANATANNVVTAGTGETILESLVIGTIPYSTTEYKIQNVHGSITSTFTQSINDVSKSHHAAFVRLPLTAPGDDDGDSFQIRQAP